MPEGCDVSGAGMRLYREKEGSCSKIAGMDKAGIGAADISSNSNILSPNALDTLFPASSSAS